MIQFLQNWEQLAALHGGPGDRYYRLDVLREGGTLMGTEEREVLNRACDFQGLHGRDVAHLQSHIGCDAITMAREGARVTAIDFSKTALTRAEALAHECGVDLTCVEADSRNLPLSLSESFDIVYATIGVLCWIDDVDAWMKGVARILRPGGRLVLVDLHPLYQMIDSASPLVMSFPYNCDGLREYETSGSYADRDLPVTSVTHQFAHGLAEIVMSAVRNGLAIVDFAELTSMSFDPGGSFLTEGPDGRFQLRLGGEVDGQPSEALPILFSLIAERRA